MWRVIGMATKDSDRYTVADFGKAQPLFRGSAGLKHGNSIPVSILRCHREARCRQRCGALAGEARRVSASYSSYSRSSSSERRDSHSAWDSSITRSIGEKDIS